MEANQNTQAFAATDCVRWIDFSGGPDSIDLIPAQRGGSILNGFPSQPIAKHGMELIAFQFTYITEALHEPTNFSLKFHFQVSQDGIHWDDLDDASFIPPLNQQVLSGFDVDSFSVEVLTLYNYIRVLATCASIEAEPNDLDAVRIFHTIKEA